jgi:membrane protein
MIAIRDIASSLYKAGVNTVQHDGIEHAGYLAFLLLLSLFPFLVLLVSFTGFLGEGEAGTRFIHFIFSQLPPHMVQALTPRVDEIVSGPPTGLLSLAILGALWTASSAVEGYRTVLNRAYHVATPPSYILRRLLSILQLIIFTFAILMAMLIVIFTPIVLSSIENFIGFQFITEDTINWSNWVFGFSIFIMFLMVGNLYYILPNVKQTLISVLPGAALTVCFWMIAAQLLTLYLSHFEQVSLIYGSLGGIIAAMLFFYVINVIFIYGAEFNYLIKKLLGERIVEREAAIATKSKDSV